jgi:hypothetical protein
MLISARDALRSFRTAVSLGLAPVKRLKPGGAQRRDESRALLMIALASADGGAANELS